MNKNFKNLLINIMNPARALQRKQMETAIGWLDLIERCDTAIKAGEHVNFYKGEKDTAMVGYAEVISQLVEVAVSSALNELDMIEPEIKTTSTSPDLNNNRIQLDALESCYSLFEAEYEDLSNLGKSVRKEVMAAIQNKCVQKL